MGGGGRTTVARDSTTLRCAAIILVAGIAAYANGLSDHFVGFNAQRSLVDNAAIRSLWPLDRAMGLHLAGDAASADGGPLVRRPVLSLSFALGYALHGPHAWGFQAGNLLIHFSAALLLFGLVRRTLRAPRLADRWAQSSNLLATVIAALWVVHPLTTESVTYVIQRAESLASLFALATVYAACRFFEAPQRRAWAIGTVAFCALGLGTKESVATLPLLVWLYDTCFFSGSPGESLRRHRMLLLCLALTWSIPAVLVLRTFADVQVDFRPGRTMPYLLAQPGVLFEYLRLSLWPHPLYLYTNTTRFTVPDILPALLQGAVIVASLLASVAGLRRGRPFAYLPAVFFLLLAPTSTVIATNDVIQEHRMYLPLAAVVSGIVIAAYCGLLRTSGPRWRIDVVFGCVAGVLVVALGSVTHARNDDYRSDFAAFYPGDLSMAHGALARHAAASGRLEEAVGRYEAILQLPPEAFGEGPPERRYHRGRAHNDLGAVLAELGRLEEARLQIDTARSAGYPLPAAENNSAVLDVLAGDADAALARLQALEMTAVRRPLLEQNIGVAAAVTGQDTLARRAFDRVLAAAPAFEVARKSRDAVGTAAETRVHLMRDYDDAWLVLFLTPKVDSASEAPEE
jgi:protein O-mannosyl-transferase